MECAKCGAELVEGAPFCGNCGASSNESRVGKQTKKKARVAAAVVLAVVLALALLRGLWLWRTVAKRILAMGTK